MARAPKHERELTSAGYPVEAYGKAQAFFAKRGVSVRHNRGSEWIIGGFKNGSATYLTCRIGTGALIDYLDAPSTLLAMFE